MRKLVLCCNNPHTANIKAGYSGRYLSAEPESNTSIAKKKVGKMPQTATISAGHPSRRRANFTSKPANPPKTSRIFQIPVNRRSAQWTGA